MCVYMYLYTKYIHIYSVGRCLTTAAADVLLNLYHMKLYIYAKMYI